MEYCCQFVILLVKVLHKQIIVTPLVIFLLNSITYRILLPIWQKNHVDETLNLLVIINSPLSELNRQTPCVLMWVYLKQFITIFGAFGLLLTICNTLLPHLPKLTIPLG